MKIVAFGASSSKRSINKQLANYAANLIKDARVQLLDLNNFEIPLFSEDREKVLGQPKKALEFLDHIAKSDALVISFAEHNGSYTAAYKNIFDWCSRITPKVFQSKPMVILSTSPGARGGAGVLSVALGSAPFFAGDVKGSLSVPSFHDNWDKDYQMISDKELRDKLKSLMQKL